MSSPGIDIGRRATREFTVTEDDTAAVVGSGSLPVLATPRLLAWCEAVCCAAVDPVLPPGSTSVSARVVLDHLAPSAVGATILVAATTSAVEGRQVRLTVTATEHDLVVASGEATRVVVDAERFLARMR